MSVKKQSLPQYIAIDLNHDRVIAIGSLVIIHSDLQDYIEDGELEEDYVEENIEVYALGDLKSVNLCTKIEITIEE